MEQVYACWGHSYILINWTDYLYTSFRAKPLRMFHHWIQCIATLHAPINRLLRCFKTTLKQTLGHSTLENLLKPVTMIIQRCVIFSIITCWLNKFYVELTEYVCDNWQFCCGFSRHANITLTTEFLVKINQCTKTPPSYLSLWWLSWLFSHRNKQ